MGDFFIKPVIKWAGGKTQLLSELKTIITPELLKDHTYFEPFAGGAALALDLKHNNTVLNDLNSELINTYIVIRDHLEELLTKLKHFQNFHSVEQYYEIRSWDRKQNYEDFNLVDKAAQFIYLNKTCFNGLYRVNNKGYFNSPIGRTSNGKIPNIVNEAMLGELSNYLNQPNIVLLNTNYIEAVKNNIKPGNTIFFDPPYNPAEEINTSGFVRYQKDGWTYTNLVELKEFCDDLVNLGVNIVLTNNNTQKVKNLFSDYEIKEISVNRNINRNGNNCKGSEVIIYKIK